ncbi:phage major capsid protein [Leucobacter sp. NPDC058333]|uniref:phage major capsid protein n=1 Tax=Leucobacter sp. NPDC058333 TaxID=3346450 RepID=UPI003655EE0C
MAAITLEGVAQTPGFIPEPIAREIITAVQAQSVVTRLAKSVPVTLDGIATLTQTGTIEAGVVGEGERKPVSSGSYSPKKAKPIKLAAICIVSKELRMRNPANILANIQADLGNSITRAVDLAVLHGTNAVTGDIAGMESLADTTNSVALGTTAVSAGGIGKDLLTGYDLVVNSDSPYAEFDGFAAHKSIRTELAGAVDAQGRPVFSAGWDLKAGIDNVMGLPTAYSNIVNGKRGVAAGSNVVAFGGNWASLQYGFAEQMTIRRTDQATIVDGDTTYHLFQDNLEAYLVEAIFGWLIPETDAFVKYTKGPATP